MRAALMAGRICSDAAMRRDVHVLGQQATQEAAAAADANVMMLCVLRVTTNIVA